jgi:cysteine desulfurase family protein (TIGR01976 family)
LIASVDEIRAHFPALKRIHSGLPVAYFDSPGGTQVPREVAEAMTRYLFEHNANTHWAYPTSEETDNIIAAARVTAAAFLNCGPNEISFGANMTTITMHLARALGRTWGRGDEVVVTELDHHANIDPWRALTEDFGIVVRMARLIPETGQIDLDHLASLVNRRTRLIAIGAASNAIGTLNDLARVRQIVSSARALFFVDAVHLAPHELIDVQDIGCDFLACSAYKFYGPHIGMLFAEEGLLESLPFPKLHPSPDSAPERAETGTQNQEGIAGLAAAIDFLALLDSDPGDVGLRLSRVFAALHDRGVTQTRMLWDGLASIEGVRLYGPDPSKPRTPTVSFTLDGFTAEEVSRALAERAIFASHGDFFAATVIERLGVEGLVRIGCACYPSDEEIVRVVEGVRHLAKRKERPGVRSL